MGLDDLDTRLAKLDEEFANAKVDTGFERFMPEPGDYSTTFREVSFFEANATGAAFLKIELEVIVDPEYAGKTIEMVYCLEPHLSAPGAPKPDQATVEMKLGFLKRDLQRLGVDTDAEDFSLGQVRPGSPLWDGLLGKTVEIAVRNSKKPNPETGEPYRNAYINGISEAIGSDIGPQALPGVGSLTEPKPQTVPDDDIPF
jgi:hypothetical protein